MHYVKLRNPIFSIDDDVADAKCFRLVVTIWNKFRFIEERNDLFAVMLQWLVM